MTLFVSSVVLGLAWFAAINIAISAGVWLIVRVLHVRGVEPRAGLWLTLRLLPAAASTFFVMAIFLPVHWRYEPPGTPETFGYVLYGLAGLALALFLRAAWRVTVAIRANRQLRIWRAAPSVPGVAGAVELEGFAVLSLAGLFRPTILVGRLVREALTADELDVALAHELAHRSAFDNIKRLAIYCAPDVFTCSATCERLESEWRDRAECDADARAARGDAGRALTLASALVKVARLSVSSPRIVSAPTWTAFYQEPLIEMRVRRLVTGCEPASASRAPAVAAGALLALCCAIWLAAVPQVIYRTTEALARLLP
jgi:hypothetical protein